MNPVSYSLLMQHVIFSLFITTLSFSTWAKPFPLNQSQLSREFQKVQNLKQVHADFTQIRHIEKWQTQIRTTGHFQLTKRPQQKMVWTIKTPSYMAIKFEGSNFYSQSDINQPWKQLKQANAQKHLDSMMAWMSFDSHKIIKDYKVLKLSAQLFEMLPKDKSSNFKKMNMKLNQSGFPEKFTLTDKTGDTIEIQFEKTKIIL